MGISFGIIENEIGSKNGIGIGLSPIFFLQYKVIMV